MDDSSFEKIISIMDEIHQMADTLEKPEIQTGYLEKGYQISKAATAQPKYVEMTPIFKNALKMTGWPKGKRLSVDDPRTKAEEVLYQTTVEKLNTLIGTRIESYNTEWAIDDPKLYRVDCWRNLKENMRDIQPGQQEQRKQAFELYQQPSRNIGVRELLKTDTVFRKAVDLVLNELPEFKANEDIVEISAPFMKKGTNVTYPYWMNDKTIVPDTNLTAGEVTRQLAERIAASPDWEVQLKQYCVWTALARNQRGKGRALIAASRVMNLVLNQIEAPQIQALKDKCRPFAGYNDPEHLKRVLIQMAEGCKQNNLWATNWDQSAYDQHVSQDLLELAGALSVLKANGERSKQLAKWRAVFGIKGWMVYGETHEIVEVLGRIFSGGIDTNAGGGTINMIISCYANMLCDPDWSDIWYKQIYAMLVMGDDNLAIRKRGLEHSKYVEAMKTISFDVNPNKGEEGVFFLQRRLFKEPRSGQYVMVTPCTRAIKSCLFKEHSSSLGPYGWTVANLQILAQLMEYEPALDVAVSVLYPYDKMHLGADLSPQQLVEGVAAEDEDARNNKKGRKNYKASSGKKHGHISAAGARRRVVTTASLLYDGDPTKKGVIQLQNGEAVISSDFLSKVMDAVRQSVMRTGVKCLVDNLGIDDLAPETEVKDDEEI